MPGIKNSSLLLILLTQITSSLFADALPPTPEFPGYTFSTFDTKDIRMKNERIDIYYGDLCKIEAVYEVVNPKNGIMEKKIGFPLNISSLQQRPRTLSCTPWNRKNRNSIANIYDCSISLNGENLVKTDAPISGANIHGMHYWYGWTCKLKPDLNIIKISYHILPSFSPYSNWERTLYFNLNSEKYWPDEIDNVQVTVHFPRNIDKRQIQDETSPKMYEIKKKEIYWKFTSIPPKSRIVLDLTDFNIFENMLKYEKVFYTPTADNETKLKAAKFFASVPRFKEYQLSTLNYLECAKKLFCEVVYSSPYNMEAWKAYLNSYYRFDNFACNPYDFRYREPYSGRSDLQRELVRKAFRYCGDDSTISLWYKYIFLSRLPPVLKFDDKYGQIFITKKISDQMATGKSLSPYEINILEKAYTLYKDRLVLNNTELDKVTYEKIVKILDGYLYSQSDYRRDFLKYKIPGNETNEIY